MPRPLLPLLLAVVSQAPVPGALAGQLTLFERNDTRLDLGGYVRSLTQLHDPGYDIPQVEDGKTGIHAEVIRLKWILHLGDAFLLEAHNRLQLQVTSSEAGLGRSAVGFGVSVVPGRRWNLSSHLVDQDRLKVWHDVDRLSLTWYGDFADITAGRQAITWGLSNLYPVADLWAQFSPFELDTEEKPGVDAVRLLKYPRRDLELDVVVADRGTPGGVSAGIRASLSLPWADLYAGGGKFWREVMGLAGIAAPLGSYKLRAEGALPFDLDADAFRLPRVTLGVDWLGGETMLSAEYNFNGIGATEAGDYLAVWEDPRHLRGETYFLGRHNLGGSAAWNPGNDRLSLTLSTLLNLQDPSGAFVPTLTYDFGQETRVTAGALLSFGDTPLFDPEPRFRSEFGAYGDFGYAMLSVYF